MNIEAFEKAKVLLKRCEECQKAINILEEYSDGVVFLKSLVEPAPLQVEVRDCLLDYYRGEHEKARREFEAL